MMRRTIFFALVTGLVLVAVAPLGRPYFGESDFLRYWASTHLLVTGGDPYDEAALFSLEHALRPELAPEGTIAQIWNPPWLLLLLAPLGLLPFDVASPIWVFINVLVVSLSVSMVWQELALPSDSRGLLLVLAASFLYVGTLSLLKMGQITSLVLLALLITIRQLRLEPDFWRDVGVGAVLLLTTVKPHIVYLALLLILIQTVRRQRWGLLVGLAGAGAISAVIVWIIFPGWLVSYFNNVSSLPYLGLYTSTIGSLMSAVFGTDLFRFSAVLLLPLVPWLSRLAEQDWLIALNLSLLLSVPLSPYGFTFDQVVLLPALAQLVFWLLRGRRSSVYGGALGVGLAALYVVGLWVASFENKPYYWLAWPPLVLLGLYFAAWKAQTHAPAYAAV
jgi:hypothetical protein